MTRQKIYSEDHKKALELNRKLNEIARNNEKFVKEWVAVAKTKKYRKDPNVEKQYEMRNANLERQEDEAYYNYYHHMSKSLGRLGEKDFGKYKKGFCDEKFVNDIFKRKSQMNKQSAKNKRVSRNVKEKSKR